MFIALTVHQSKQINLLWLLDVSMQITPAHSASIWHLWCKTKKEFRCSYWVNKKRENWFSLCLNLFFVCWIHLFLLYFFLCFLILYLSQTKSRLGLEWGVHYLSYCPHVFFCRGHSRGCALLAEWLGRLSKSTCILSPAVVLVAAVSSMHNWLKVCIY